MKTTEEMIAVMQHYANGGEVEYSHRGQQPLWTKVTKPSWDWGPCDYRIAKTKKVGWIVLAKTDNHIISVPRNRWCSSIFYDKKELEDRFESDRVIIKVEWEE